MHVYGTNSAKKRDSENIKKFIPKNLCSSEMILATQFQFFVSIFNDQKSKHGYLLFRLIENISIEIY